MLQSKYLKRYQVFNKSGPKGALYGNRILLEIIEIADDKGEHKTSGGIIIAESNHGRSDFVMLKATLGIVLEVGKGYYDPDTKEDIPLDIKIGDVVWVPAMSLQYLSTIPGMSEAVPNKCIALGSEGEVIKKWDSIKAYEADKKALSGIATND